MIVGIGIDIIEVERIQKMLDEYEEHALNKIFASREVEYCNSFGKRKYEHYAARFAVKEAFSKAIGTGLTQRFKFKDVYIDNEASGKPVIILQNEMKERYGHYKIYVSIAHTQGNAIAQVIIESN